jgi:hypothetical protein
MAFTSIFYHRKIKRPEGFITGLLLLTAIVGFSIYSMVNFAKYGSIFKKTKYNRVELVELMSYGNFHNGKNVCTKGYYVEDDKLRLLKLSLEEDRFTRTAWVITENREIITRVPGASTKAVEAEICGKFESARDGEFGEPPVWIQQITVDSYETFGDPVEVTYPI